MKRFLLFISFLAAVFALQAQSLYTFPYDSIYAKKGVGNSELILMNSTRSISGFLFNKGNGRTEFRKPLIRLTDTTYLVGLDTLVISKGKNYTFLPPLTTSGATIGVDTANYIATLLRLRDTALMLRAWVLAQGYLTSITAGTGITVSGSTVNADLSTGVAGGQSVIGGTASGNNLTLSSTSHATKGKVLFGTSAYNEANNRLGLGTTSPTEQFDITGNINMVNSTPTAGILYKNNTPFIHNYTPGSTYVGLEAGNFTSTGSNNTGIGYLTLNTNTTGSYNNALGLLALASNTSGDNNVAVGYSALVTNTSGASNTAVGFSSIQSNTLGSQNSALGYYALYSNTVGQLNTAIGSSALFSNTSGHYNTGIGHYAGASLTTGSYNIAIGPYVDVPVNTGSRQLNIGNVLYGVNLYNTNLPSSTPTTNGRIGIGLTTPTARLHLPAGTATANTAPLKFTSGTNLTTPEAGAVEFDGTHFYGTVGSTRYQLDQQTSGLSSTYFGKTGNAFGADATLGLTDNFNLKFYTNNTERARLTNDGNFLIGNTSSVGSYKLQINGPSFHGSNGSNNIIIDPTGSAPIGVSSNSTGTARVTVANSNSTSSTAAAGFDMFTNGGGALSVLKTNNLSSDPLSAQVNNVGGNLIFNNYNAGTAVKFNVNSATRFEIKESEVNLNASAKFSKALFVKDTTTTSNVTLTSNYYFVRIDANAGNVTITLPLASSVYGSNVGIEYLFKRIDNSSNTVTIQRSGSDTIDGATNFTISALSARQVRSAGGTSWDIY